jgi:rfaE bifunctional protein nucleotidyltransferase chain/domain
VRVATPSVSDLGPATKGFGPAASGRSSVERLAQVASNRWRCPVVLTCGGDGAVLFDGGPAFVAGTSAVGDPNGAGDHFAAELTHALAGGDGLHDAVVRAVRAGARHVRGDRAVGSGHLHARSERRVVATSGCFDILHAGHLSMLQFARSLGDELVVCLNSDRSVRALKGDRRPITPQAEREALLRALALVDRVVVFDEATPCEVLRTIRPAVFVKGGDYVDRRLPEHDVLAEWGGEVVFGPLVPERSTTRLLDVARFGAG